MLANFYRYACVHVSKHSMTIKDLGETRAIFSANCFLSLLLAERRWQFYIRFYGRKTHPPSHNKPNIRDGLFEEYGPPAFAKHNLQMISEGRD